MSLYTGLKGRFQFGLPTWWRSEPPNGAARGPVMVCRAHPAAAVFRCARCLTRQCEGCHGTRKCRNCGSPPERGRERKSVRLRRENRERRKLREGSGDRG